MDKKSLGSNISNIWYHYKFRIIIIAFLVITGIYTLFTALSKDPVDMHIFYVTKDPMIYTEEVIALSQSIAAYTEDLNGDSDVRVRIENIFLGEEYNPEVIFNNKNRIMTILRTGDNMFFLADRTGMDFLIEADAMDDISDIAGTEYYGGMAWYANESPFIEREMLENWDRELYMGIRIYEGTLAQILPKSEEKYQNARKTLERIINNTPLILE